MQSAGSLKIYFVETNGEISGVHVFYLYIFARCRKRFSYFGLRQFKNGSKSYQKVYFWPSLVIIDKSIFLCSGVEDLFCA